ncbi:MAG: DnaD domain protein [Clostridia bacterium]|nr:DnaD domain protein [Clostridia bacterium]
MMRCVFSSETAMLDITPVENIFICEHMPSAPAEYVKAYLYGLMLCRNPQLEADDALLALKTDAKKLLEAFTYWQSRGLVRIVGDAPDDYQVRFLSPRASAFSSPVEYGRHGDLVNNLNALFSPRLLSSAELRHVYDWVEVFGLSAEAVYELCAHCAKQKGKRVSVNYMEAVAKNWADEGVSTREQALERIAREGDGAAGAKKLLARWGMSRRPTLDEQALYEKWTRGWGFTHESIVAVCMSMTFAANPSFKALDTILERYRQQGAVSAEDIDELMKREDGAKEFARMVFTRAGLASAPRASQREQLRRFTDAWRMDRELILLAADLCARSAAPWASMVKLITQWHDEGITGDLDAARRSHEASSAAPKRKSSRAAMYQKHEYTDEDFKRIGVTFLDD